MSTPHVRIPARLNETTPLGLNMNLSDSSKYFSGLFDAEGSCYVSFGQSANKYGLQASPTLKICMAPYVAGLFDGDGSISIGVAKGEARYLVKCHPYLNISGSDSLLSFIQQMYGGRVTHLRGKVFAWTVNKIEDVARIVDILLEFSILKRPQLLLMKTVVLPMFHRGEHLTVEGLTRLIEIAGCLNPNRRRGMRDWKRVLNQYLAKRRRACVICGKDISHRRLDATKCSAACNTVSYRRLHPDSRKGEYLRRKAKHNAL